MSLPTMRQFAVLAALWALLALVAVAAGGGGMAVADAPGGNVTQPADVASSGDTQRAVEGPGAQLSGLVAVQNQSIRGTIRAGSLQAQFETTDSPERRAAVVDQFLASTEGRVTELEQRLSTLSNGAGQDATTAERAAIGSSARALDELLGESERVVSALPADARESRNLGARLDALDERVETLRQQTRESVRAIGGANETTRVDPLSVEDVEAATNNALNASGQPGPISGSEEIDYRIKTANGSTLRVGVVVDGGAVEEVEGDGIDSPDVAVYTDYEIVRAVQRSDEPFAEIRDAIDDGRLVYDGSGLINSFRYGVASWLSRL